MTSVSRVKANKMPFLKKRALKNVPMPPMSRIVPDRRETLNLSDFIVKLMEDFSTIGIE